MKSVLVFAVTICAVLCSTYAQTGPCECSIYVTVGGADTPITTEVESPSYDCSSSSDCSAACLRRLKVGTSNGNLCYQNPDKPDTIGNRMCKKIGADLPSTPIKGQYTLCGTKTPVNVDFVSPLSCSGGKFAGSC